MPATVVRLAAGRVSLREEQQVQCFQAGANAVFTGEKMLTTECNGWEEDRAMFERWGFYPMRSFEREERNVLVRGVEGVGEGVVGVGASV